MNSLNHIIPDNRRVLIIDDNAEIHRDLRKVLAGDDSSNELDEATALLFGETADMTAWKFRYELDSAFQGREGYDLVVKAVEEGRPYALAVVDMRMPPGWDGLETIRRIWEADNDLQIVICTAYSDHSWTEVMEKLPTSEQLLILKKPFDIIEISQLTASLTSRWRLAQLAKLNCRELEAMVEQRTAALQKETEERLRAEKEVHERDQLLARRHRLESIGTLAGGVSHEFNNLLQAISGYTCLAMDSLPPETQPYLDLEQACTATHRAATIARQLLAFSRPAPPCRGSVNLGEKIRTQLEMLAPLLGEHIAVELSAPDEEVTISADEAMIEQVIMNLCINARDAVGPMGRLAISLERHTNSQSLPELEPGEYARLKFTDNGCGMSADVQRRIFDPFFTTKPVGKGTGLGLWTVYGIVQSHQGRIDVDSTSGRGTSFTIWLPIVAETSPPAIQTSLPVQCPRGTGTVLLADDEPMVRSVAERILASAGYTVITAKDGQEAIEKFESNREAISLALLDIVMPRCDGHEAYERISQATPDLNVLFCTGYDPTTARTHTLAQRGHTVIQKPFDRHALLEAVHEALQKKSDRSAARAAATAVA